MKLLLTLFTAVLVACHGQSVKETPAVGVDAGPTTVDAAAPENDTSAALMLAPPAPETSPTPDLDRELERYLDQKPLDKDAHENWDTIRNAKMSGAKEVNVAYKAAAAADPDDRDLAAHVGFQRARLFLSVGCSIGLAPLPEGLSDQELAKFRSIFRETAHLMFPGADEALRNAVKADGALSPLAGKALLLLRTKSGISARCKALESIWLGRQGLLSDRFR